MLQEWRRGLRESCPICRARRNGCYLAPPPAGTGWTSMAACDEGKQTSRRSSVSVAGEDRTDKPGRGWLHDYRGRPARVLSGVGALFEEAGHQDRLWGLIDYQLS